jgi:hypothetical protein
MFVVAKLGTKRLNILKSKVLDQKELYDKSHYHRDVEREVTACRRQRVIGQEVSHGGIEDV